VGKPVQAGLLSLSRQVLILIPAMLILPRFFGVEGVLYAGPLSDLVSSAITGVFLFYELRHLDSKHQGMQTNET
jgi:Na+-driven multidrug efflux pump